MRYYHLEVRAPGQAKPKLDLSTKLPNGQNNMGALNITFDFPVVPYAIPTGGATVIIEGISLKSISEANQYAGSMITLHGGMQKGLPLADPKQSGIILHGFIFQSFGNWQGTEMALSFVVLASPWSNSNVGNFSFHWESGTPAGAAISQFLSPLYPDLVINDLLPPNVMFMHKIAGQYGTLEDFAIAIRHAASVKIDIAISGKQLSIMPPLDDQAPTFARTQPVKQLKFTDLIGQPTWINVLKMQIKVVLRADLGVGDLLQMPKDLINAPGIVATSANSRPSNFNQKSAFMGKFRVTELRHIGDFRSSDSSQWVTILNCVAYNGS